MYPHMAYDIFLLYNYAEDSSLTNIYFLLIVLVSVVASQQKRCERKIDIAFIYEIPTMKAAREFSYLREIVDGLNKGRKADDCNQLSLIAAGTDVKIVQALGCHPYCELFTKRRLDEVANQLTNDRSAR